MGTSLIGQRTQRDYAVYRHFTDQHGRIFEAQANVFNQRPMEELRPINCQPYWLPTMRFIDWDGDGLLTFRWNYRRMANELSIHTNHWYSNARKMALKEHLEIPEVGGEVDQLIKDVFGAPGLSPEIPLSCEYGDEWMIWGDLKPRNERLFGLLNQGNTLTNMDSITIIENRIRESLGQAPIARTGTMAPPTNAETQSTTAFNPSHVKYSEFFGEARKRGLSTPEISIAWKEHKKALQEDAA